MLGLGFRVQGTWKTQWKEWLYRGSMGLEVYKQYLHRALSSMSTTYIEVQSLKALPTFVCLDA